MFGLLRGMMRYAAVTGYVVVRASMAQSVTHLIKDVAQDGIRLFTLPWTLFQSAHQAQETYKACKEMADGMKENWMLKSVAPLVSVGCEPSQWYAIIAATGALYVSYRLFPYAQKAAQMAYAGVSMGVARLCSPATPAPTLVSPEQFGALAKTCSLTLENIAPTETGIRLTVRSKKALQAVMEAFPGDQSAVTQGEDAQGQLFIRFRLKNAIEVVILPPKPIQEQASSLNGKTTG